MFRRFFGSQVGSAAAAVMPQAMQEQFLAARTRAHLHAAFKTFQAQHGTQNAGSALEKTNYKYLMASGTPFGEHPDAEATAVQGMGKLMVNHYSKVTGNDCADHLATQEADASFHRGVVNGTGNPYGPFTSALTSYAPVGVRAAYSKLTAGIPRVFDR